jgi:hypothetical protein
MKTTRCLLLITILSLLLPVFFSAGEAASGLGNYTAGNLVERNSPVGTVREPGSQLLFILDTGYNPLYLENEPGYHSRSILEMAGVSKPHYINYVSITNSSPKYSVTVHFQYYNCYMQPILDFLAVLTCNDTMMVDSLDIIIPGSNGINVRERFFGGLDQLQPDQFIPSLSSAEFGDGRFLLTVTAVGDPKGLEAGDPASVYSPYWDGNRETFDPDYENIDLFPAELVTWDTLDQSCKAYSELEVPASVIGNTPGINDDNLHIFNATAISFNYLVGMHALGCGTSACNGAYIVDAFARPSRNRHDALETDPNFFVGQEVPVNLVLSGGEKVYHRLNAKPLSSYLQNQYYLRWESGNEVNNGKPMAVDQDSDYVNDLMIHSQGGSIAWAMFPIAWSEQVGFPPPSQYLNMLSLADDYNGSGTAVDPVFPVRSYSLSPLLSIYLLTVYNNSEDFLEAEYPEDVIIPVPDDYPFTLAIGVKGMNAWSLEGEAVNARLDLNLYRFGVDDIYRIRGEDVIDFLSITTSEDLSEKTPEEGDVDFSILNAPPAGGSGYISEKGPGWVRFSRLLVSGIWENNNSFLKKQTIFDGHFSSAVTIAQHINMFRAIGYGAWSSSSGYDEERFNQLFLDVLEAAGAAD